MDHAFSSLKERAKSFFSGFFSLFFETEFRWFDLWFLGIYGAAIAFGAWRHEPWSDEAFPWVIARDADLRTFLTIFLTNQDKHPGLFYCILLPFAKLGFPYYTQAVLNFLFAMTAAFLFLTRAPFCRIFRYLFLLSFFMIYEYSVITRTYMLSVMLIFCLAVFYPQRSERPWTYALLLILLLHADYMNFGLGVGLTLGFAIENRHRLFRFSKSETEKAVSLVFLLMAINVLWIFWVGHSLPEDHPDFGQKLPVHLENLVKPVANAFLPFSDLGMHTGLKTGMAIFGGAAIIVLTFISLVPTPVPAMVLGTSLGNLLLVFTFLHRGDYRHHGFILISVIFSLWIAAAYTKDTGIALQKWKDAMLARFRRAGAAAVFIIGIFIAMGMQNIPLIYALEYFRDFSGAKRMAETIQKAGQDYHLFEKGFVIVAKHRNAIGLLPYLPGVRFWNPCTGNYPTYYKVDKKLAACDDLSLYAAVQLAKARLGDLSKTLLLFEQPLPFTEDNDYRYQKVFAVGQRAFGYMHENFFLYLPVRKQVERKEGTA